MSRTATISTSTNLYREFGGLCQSAPTGESAVANVRSACCLSAAESDLGIGVLRFDPTAMEAVEAFLHDEATRPRDLWRILGPAGRIQSTRLASPASSSRRRRPQRRLGPRSRPDQSRARWSSCRRCTGASTSRLEDNGAVTWALATHARQSPLARHNTFGGRKETFDRPAFTEDGRRTSENRIAVRVFHQVLRNETRGILPGAGQITPPSTWRTHEIETIRGTKTPREHRLRGPVEAQTSPSPSRERRSQPEDGREKFVPNFDRQKERRPGWWTKRNAACDILCHQEAGFRVAADSVRKSSFGRKATMVSGKRSTWRGDSGSSPKELHVAKEPGP